MKVRLLALLAICQFQAGWCEGASKSSAALGENPMEAISEAARQIVDKLNASLEAGDFSDESYEKLFGSARQTAVRLNEQETPYLLRLEKMVSPAHPGETPEISITSLAPQACAKPNGGEGVYFVFLKLKNSTMDSGVLFFSVESIIKTPDGKFNAVAVPGRIFTAY